MFHCFFLISRVPKQRKTVAFIFQTSSNIDRTSQKNLDIFRRKSTLDGQKIDPERVQNHQNLVLRVPLRPDKTRNSKKEGWCLTRPAYFERFGRKNGAQDGAPNP